MAYGLGGGALDFRDRPVYIIRPKNVYPITGGFNGYGIDGRCPCLFHKKSTVKTFHDKGRRSRQISEPALSGFTGKRRSLAET